MTEVCDIREVQLEIDTYLRRLSRCLQRYPLFGDMARLLKENDRQQGGYIHCEFTLDRGITVELLCVFKRSTENPDAGNLDKYRLNIHGKTDKYLDIRIENSEFEPPHANPDKSLAEKSGKRHWKHPEDTCLLIPLACVCACIRILQYYYGKPEAYPLTCAQPYNEFILEEWRISNE